MTDIENSQDNYLKMFIIIVIGLLVVSIAFPLLAYWLFSDWTKSGTFGDTYGALNAVFSGAALAGVIVTILMQRNELKNQQVELSLQRSEMIETRKEMLTNRVTNLVFGQLERFERCIQDFSFTHEGKIFKGYDAIFYLNKNKELVYHTPEKSQEIFDEEMRQATIKLLQLYNPNKNEIEIFARNAFNSVQVLKRLIFKTDLEVEELNDIKNIYFENIGYSTMEVLNRISEVAKGEHKYLKDSDFDTYDLEVGELNRANIYLIRICKFDKEFLSKDNYFQLREEWLEGLGSNN